MEQFIIDENYTDDLNTIVSNMSVLTCSEKRLLGGPIPFSQTAFDVLRYLQIVLFTIGFPVGIILNTMVIVLVAKFKSLHQTTFYLALQVVVVDLFITLFVFPTTTANVIADRWVFGAAGCPSFGFVLFMFRNMRNFLMFVFVTDRLLTVFTPFWYLRRNNRLYVVVPLSILAWIFAIIYGIIPVALDCHDYGRIAWGCTVNKGCTYPKACEAYKLTSIVLSNIIGGLIPLVMYIVLFCKARQLRKRLPQYHVEMSTTSASNETINNDSMKNSNTINGIACNRKNSIYAFLSCVSSKTNQTVVIMTRKTKEEKATVTFLILFLSMCGVSFPSTFFFIIGQSVFSGFGLKPPEGFIVASIFFRTLFNFLVIIDPIAVMRNRDIKNALQKCYKNFKYKIKKRARLVEATNYNRTSVQDSTLFNTQSEKSYQSSRNDSTMSNSFSSLSEADQESSRSNSSLTLSSRQMNVCELTETVCESSGEDSTVVVSYSLKVGMDQ